jgi:hypothetical protein
MQPAPRRRDEQTPLVRFALGLPPWLRALVALVVLAAFAVVPVRAGWRVVTAERVTIQIVSCPAIPAAKDAGCVGTWRLADGTAGRATIDGYAPVDGAGVAVPGWATATEGTAQLSIWLVPPLTALAVAVVVLILLLLLTLRLRLRARARRR